LWSRGQRTPTRPIVRWVEAPVLMLLLLLLLLVL
jgi:hypothetical protein